MTTPPAKYLVAFVKLVSDREQGILSTGTYFGGVADGRREAEQIARECHRFASKRNVTVLPRVFFLCGEGRLIGAMDRAEEWFEHLVERMRETLRDRITRGR